MLKSLFGCKSIEKILLFLLVNESCYAHQLHRMLHVPLTPIQKGLVRLEKGNVIVGQTEGKSRIFRFNPNYPLLKELEMLLRKAFASLSLAEKRDYYFLKYENGERKQHQEILQLIWNQLKCVSTVALISKSNNPTDKKAIKGNGKVSVKQDNQTIIFTEQGSWKGERNQVHNYSNSFRWTWNRLEGMISLEHLRYGSNNPTFLFHLIPSKGNRLESECSHACGDDTYFGWLSYSDLFLQLHFRTIGPRKNEELQYIYT